MSKGCFERKIYLPAENFIYGQRNRTPTPIKQIVNYDYARKAENEILNEYDDFMRNKTKLVKYEPKTTNHHDKMMLSRKTIQKKEEKPLYKMRMFSDVGSKVVVGIKNFKTFDDKNLNSKTEGNNNNTEDAQIDNMIEKIENELKELQEDNNNNEQKGN